MPKLKTTFALLLLGMPLLARGQQPIAPGSHGRLDVPGSGHPCVLYVPSDYDASRTWPLILFLHGSGGRPTTWPFREATEGKGYLIVGLSYGALADGGRKGIPSDAANRLAMVRFIDKAHALVEKQYRVDGKRVFLGGISQGGFGVNFYGFHPAAKGKYRGYAILAAGAWPRGYISFAVARGKPVIVLNGAGDHNLQAARNAKTILQRAGAIVTQIELAGHGHVPSTDAMAGPLRRWLADNRFSEKICALLARARKAEAEGHPRSALHYYKQAQQAGLDDAEILAHIEQIEQRK